MTTAGYPSIVVGKLDAEVVGLLAKRGDAQGVLPHLRHSGDLLASGPPYLRHPPGERIKPQNSETDNDDRGDNDNLNLFFLRMFHHWPTPGYWT